LTSDTFGRRLTAIRTDRALSQAELGTVLGKSKQTVCRWEHGLAINAADLTRCARALGCRRFDLLAPVDAPIPAARGKRQRLRRNCALRRLRKDRPDFIARVLAGELSPHAAMVEAGLRKKRPDWTVPPTGRVAVR
jgi:transcriptional regulator with XRE-family HTH domain